MRRRVRSRDEYLWTRETSCLEIGEEDGRRYCDHVKGRVGGEKIVKECVKRGDGYGVAMYYVKC